MTFFLLLQENYRVLPLCCFHLLQCFSCLLNLSTFKREAFSPTEANRSKKTKLLRDILLYLSQSRADSVLAVKVAFDKDSGGGLNEVVVVPEPEQPDGGFH